MTSTPTASPSRSAADRIPVGVFGATGYTGRELVRLLERHPEAELVFVSSRSEAAEPSAVPGLAYVHPDEAPVDEAELVFLCLPHGEAAARVDALRDRTRIVDLTADHRPGSGREADAVYGLAERNGEDVREARLVANPGCYPTGVLLSLTPLAEAGLIDRGRLTTVSAASGVTGAGRTPKAELLFAEVSGNFRAYGEGNRHRHLKEMRALLPEMQLLFQPHLLPVARGILETIVVPVADGVTAKEVREAWRGAYAGSGAVRVLDEGLPDLAGVTDTDRLDLGAVDVQDVADPTVMIVAALDNLGKGAAGQAVQNMNLMFGRPMNLGIRVD